MRRTPPRGSAARRGCYAALLFGALGLALMYISPLAGAALAIVFLGVAWSVWRQRAWAAIGGVCFLLAPIPMAATHLSPGQAPGFILGALIELVIAFLLAQAAIELWHDPANRSALPWAPLSGLFLVFWLVFRPFAISAGSMENTLLRGDQILVETVSWRLGRTPSLGDLVVLEYPLDRKQLFIKRVVAGPGDRIRIRDKRLYRNGDEVSEPYVIHSTSYADSFRDDFPSAPVAPLAASAENMLRYHVSDGEVLIPDGSYFVLGDNRDDSLDSRYWGFISLHDIVGTPVLVYASYLPQAGAAKGVNTVRNIRWNRLSKIPR